MANNYFQFKQFTVHQQDCAMKVCTDACLFGAYVADELSAKNNCAQYLDIGTGTGLLSLMLAQKTNAFIDAAEIEISAYKQAVINFKQSPWQQRLTIFNIDILRFTGNKKYDCIISNPPFFEADLKSSDNNKNAAKHETALTLQQLLQVVIEYLQPDGFFAVLLPFHRINYCEVEAAKLDLFLTQKILVKQTPKHNYFRGILYFKRTQTGIESKEIIIKNETGQYSTSFVELLKDYYLNL